MSIPINTDNSVQLTYSSFPFTITNVDNYASSNFVLSLSSNNSNYTKNASNALKANIDLKQDILTASTNLSGIGSAITTLDYNKITLNKPTNFQADWLTTIINKPSIFPADMTNIYTKIETNNLISSTSNYTLNASNALRSSINNIYTKTETNNLITNSSNYTLNTSNALQTNINTTNNNFANYLPKSGGTISGLLTTGNITISGTTGRLNVMDDYHYIEFSQATDTTTIMEYGKVVFLIGPTRTERTKINASGLTATAFFGNGAGITSLDYNNILTNKPSTFPADMTNIYTKIETNNLLGNKQDTLTAATSLLGNGSAITNIAYANITGKPTNFQADWLTTIINKPSTFTPDTNNIYTKTETDGRYLQLSGGTMTGQISGITILNATTINSSTILSTTNNASSLGPTKGINGSTGDRLVLWPGNSIAYPYSLGINGYTLWYSVPDGASHKFYVNGSLITTISSTGLSTTGTISGTTFSGSGSSLTDIPYASITGKPTNFQADWLTTIINKPSTFPADMTNIYTKIETDGRYLKLGGGTMTGQLIFTTTDGNNPIRIYSSLTGANNCIQFQNDNSKVVYLGLGGSLISGPNYKNNFFIESKNGIILNVDRGSASEPNFIINSSGNVGIGTTNPTEDLHIYGNDNTFLKVDAVGGTGQSGLRLFAGSGTTNRATRIDFFNNVASTASARWSLLSDTDQNGTNDFRIYNAGGSANVLTLLQSGNIGIGITNPTCKLSLGSSTGYKVLSLYDNGLNDNFQFVGFGASGGLCFNNFGTGDAFQFRVGASTTAANEVMRINGNGSVCIGTASATSTNTKLTISGASYGYPEPLVNIIQTRGWDGNYALQVSGYTNLGGIRINGGDLGNSIYKTDAGTMGLSTTNGAIYIFVNGVEKAKFDTNGITNISGVLTVPNITIGNGGKINTVDDYHYIQISQATDTLTIQEYGTISFNIGQTKTQKAYINSGGLGVNGSLNVSGLTRHTQLFNYGETVSYQTGFNATPSANGWFWMTNGLWSGYNTPSYLIITVMANGNGAVWYGRAFLKQGGGFWDIICDFRSPNGAANTITVGDFWGSNGANALMITIQNAVYAGTFNIKISG